VFGLSLYTTERELKDIFSKYGPIEDVQVVYDRQTGRSRGFAFVYYDEIDDAREAKEKTNGVEVDGRRIRVDFSITKRPHTPTPGIYMGKPTRPRDADYESSRYSPSPYGSRRRSRSPSYSPRRY
jgi:transformer-2 protein